MNRDMNTSAHHFLIAEDDLGHSTAIHRRLVQDYPEAIINVVTSICTFREYIAGSTPSLVILDLNLSDGCTLDLLTAPAGESPFPVIMMTSYGNENVAVESIKRGALEYIVKSAEAFNAIGVTVAGALREWQLLQDKKRMELELVESQAMIIQQEKMASIGQLAAGVAHEINNPMAFIGSNIVTMGKYIEKYNLYIEKLEDEVKNKNDGSLPEEIRSLSTSLKLGHVKRDIRNLVQECNDGVEHIKQIVLDLKTFARPDTMKATRSDINECLNSTLNIVKNELKYCANIIKDYGDLPKTNCNIQQINQVLLNLLVNASHALQAKGGERGEIVIKTWHERENVFIAISDTGCGIQPENINKVFDVFFTTKDAGQGTGLGLSISTGIIRKHGGEITVASRAGIGTTFTVRLPVDGPDADEHEQPKENGL